MSDLCGKYAVVTGGGQGIGAAIVKRFIAEKAAGVAILDFNTEKARIDILANNAGIIKDAMFHKMTDDQWDLGLNEGFTKTLAKDCARKNITVNAIGPAHLDTEMQRSVPTEILQKTIQSNPSQRLGTTDELAAVAFLLANDDSSFVNGVVIPVCGGVRT